MHKLVRNLLTEWRKLELPFDNETFIIAVSGGADSVALTLALHDLHQRKKLDLHFVIAHFNHLFRGRESDDDAKFVENLSEKMGFRFVGGIAAEKFQISKKGNLEQNARLTRYKFLSEVAENFNAYGILTAHTINDQAETFLLNLIRGSGIAGLTAMKPVTTIDLSGDLSSENRLPPKLIRPFLHRTTRDDTENYCREMQIGFRTDSMNEDLKFKRVQVRKILLPVLKEFNPKIIETLARTARLLQTEISSKSNFQSPVDEARFLILGDLKTLPKSELYEVLRGWLKQNRGSLRKLELKHIEAIERLILSRKSGRKVELPDGETVVKKDGKLHLQKRKVEKSVLAN